MASTQGRVSPTHALISSVSLRRASREFTLFEVGWISGGVFVVCAVVNNSSLHEKTKNKNKIIHRLICKSVSAVLKCFPHTIKITSIASLPVRSEAELTLSGQRFSSFFFFLLFFLRVGSMRGGLASTYIAACRHLTSVLLCGVAACRCCRCNMPPKLTTPDLLRE